MYLIKVAYRPTTCTHTETRSVTVGVNSIVLSFSKLSTVVCSTADKAHRLECRRADPSRNQLDADT